jgi:hypothetical protein
MSSETERVHDRGQVKDGSAQTDRCGPFRPAEPGHATFGHYGPFVEHETLAVRIVEDSAFQLGLWVSDKSSSSAVARFFAKLPSCR